MGLTKNSVGIKAVDGGLVIQRENGNERVVALAGNPNVGKSTVFNALTGMNQHTGNWPGKTVSNAQGYCKTENNSYILVDIPGTYSLMAHSAEEEVARNFICFGEPDAVVVVCDATCLERNLNLVIQTVEICKNTVVCVNLLDEARRKGIKLDLKKLSERLGVPVVGTVAQKKKTLTELMKTLDKVPLNTSDNAIRVRYPDIIEEAVGIIEDALNGMDCKRLDKRWLSLKLLENDPQLEAQLKLYLGSDFLDNGALKAATVKATQKLQLCGVRGDKLKDMIVSSIVLTAEKICNGVVTYAESGYRSADRKIDRVLTSRWGGYPVMLLLMAFIFWLTISGANYPSELLSKGLFAVQDMLSDLFMKLGAPEWLHGALVMGVYRVLAWVVSVMLPPMAIFFPLFTLLEDSGYLPRVAYNLDRPFKRCCACGKQALTMCMGFGCNAAGVVGCRIIDSPRERLLAILTNSFVPCNGRFPTIITVIAMFFVGSAAGVFSSVLSAVLLTAVIVLGILMTFLSTKLLSKTVLKGVPSSFTLELPPYRKPQIGKVIVRSVFDRTLFVLGRAAAVAAPAGLIIWLAANVTVGESSILQHCANFLDPFARLMGLDGVILIAFILGFPANEIVVPIIIMAYTANGSITELPGIFVMKNLLEANGWTWITAICFLIFCLMHWPCSTTLITIKKETDSLKWTALAAALPTVFGIVLCILFNLTAKMFL